MAATTLRLNETIKNAYQLSAALAMEHDLLNGSKRLELNLAQAEEQQTKFKPNYQNRGQGRLAHSKGRFFKPHEQKKKFPLRSSHNCGKYGYFKNDCPQNKKNLMRKSKNRKDQIKVSLWELLSAMLVMLLRTLMDGRLTLVQPAILQRLKTI